jgi:membrane protease YdiL (CAAX protease family)
MTTAADDLFALAPDWRGRAVAFGKVLVFVVLLAGLGAGGLLLVERRTDAGAPFGGLSDFFRVQLVVSLCVVLANGGVLVIFREPPSHAGLGGRRRLGDFAVGFAAGAAALCALVMILAGLGAVRLTTATLAPDEALLLGLTYFALFALVAVAEQGVFRAWPLVQLSRAIGFWPAAAGLAVLFGLLHLTNDGDTVIGAAVAGLFGLIMAWSFRLSGALWFALGAHTAWDFTETFVFGAANSGWPGAGGLLHATPVGPAILSGGGAGPEGSLLALVAMPVLAPMAALWLRPRPSP